MNTNKHENLVSTTQFDKGFDEKFEEWETCFWEKIDTLSVTKSMM